MIDYFKKEISSSGKPYFRNKIRNETQWGFYTYENTNKRLPRGYVRLNVNGESFYKYNEPVLPTSYDYSDDYAPREFDIFQMRYDDLIDQDEEEQQEEICRRNNLFQKVARRLKLETDSIYDESLEFLAVKAEVPIKQIIAYIQETESKQLGKKAILTPFSTIKRTDSSFSTKRSIRELCGVNTRELEAEQAMNQIQHQFMCPLSLNAFTDPVTCSSGHTFEREHITILIKNKLNPVCPISRLPITGHLVPTHALRKVIDQFIEKYKNQKGDHWAPILEFCVTYTNFTGRLQVPIDIILAKIEPSVPLRVVHAESGSDDARARFAALSADLSRFQDSDYARARIAEFRDMIRVQTEGIRASLTASARTPNPPPTSRLPVNHETGRNPDEIRAFLIENGYNLDIIDNIPEIIANSSRSSFGHALAEANRRIEDPEYREEHRSRTAEELLEYYTRLTPEYAEDLRTPEAYDAAVQTANSAHNSYARASYHPIGGQWFIDDD